MTVDRLPDGWARVKLVDVAVNSTAVSSSPIEDGYERYVLGKDIPDGGTIETWGEVGDGHFGSRIRTRIEAGDVVCTTRGPNLRVARATFRALGAHTNFVLRTADKNVLLPDFLALLAESEGFQTHLSQNFRGSVNLFVNWSDAARYEFALPPVEEQREIVAVLGRQAASGEARLKAVRLAEQLLRATLLEHLNRWSDLPKVRCGEVADVQVGKKLDPDARRGVRPREYLRAANLAIDGIVLDDVKTMDFLESEDHALSIRAGDILLVEGGDRDKVAAPTLVRVCPPRQLYIQNTIVRLRPLTEAPLSGSALYWIWRACYVRRDFERHSVGTKLYHFGPKRVADYVLPTPSLEEQGHFVAVAERLWALVEALRESQAADAKVARALQRQLLDRGPR